MPPQEGPPQPQRRCHECSVQLSARHGDPGIHSNSIKTQQATRLEITIAHTFDRRIWEKTFMFLNKNLTERMRNGIDSHVLSMR